MESQRQERSSNPVRARRSKAVTIHGLRPGGPKGSTLATTTLQLTTTRPARSATAALEPTPGLERGSGETGEEFLRRYQQVPGAVYPAAGLPSINGAVYMRWGFTTPNVDNSHIEWRGWGYRKIQAKHGWGSDDLEATRVALLDPTPELDPTIAGRYR